ncbi:MAG: peptidoglycan synthetase, partial [Flavobacteriaceae bacterium]|nr:peptidoglycan synthetase [Flavobacteriaceae bacterium]
MRIHFIAIGGAAMHNLAIALKGKNYIVSGSDDVINDPSKSRLMKYGLLPKKDGWDAEKISKELDAVILGMHAKSDNPELLRARELKVKIFSYPEFIFNQSINKFRVVIGGSHGKTTITSMILHVMNFNNIEVDYMVGAQLKGFDVMVKITEENKFIILEGDEYLTSPIDLRPKFHLYKPDLALISGIAWDHINVFPTYEIYLEQFKIFIDSIQKNGTLVYNSDDIDLNSMVKKTTNNINKVPYNTPSYFVKNNITYLDMENKNIPLKIFGEHNLNNLMGAKFICKQMGIDEDNFFSAITSFDGASNRLELICKNSNSIAYKDFAHSPSKVIATTSAVRSQNSDKKIVACLELH